MIERPLEPNEEGKCYKFEAIGYVKIKGYVWANSYDEAEELIINREYDDYDITELEEIEEITKIKEE